MATDRVKTSDASQHWTIRGKPSFDLEYISLNGRECFRVRHCMTFVGYCYNIEQLRRLLELRDLSPADHVEWEFIGPYLPIGGYGPYQPSESTNQ